MTRKIAVLLSTYGGAEYLPMQLESIERQRGVDWVLLWRDDGSRDGSIPIMEGFARRTSRVVRVEGPPRRLGPARSYMALLEAAPEDHLLAFCDQDDVWLPGKLERAAEWLKAPTRDRPLLHCGRQRLVDRGLREIGLSPLPGRPPGFANALVQNIATGCTVVINPAARRLVLGNPVPAGSMHDWWCYLLVSGCGGEVRYDAEPQILYRQHAANAVGAAARPWTRAVLAARRGAGTFLSTLSLHLEALAGAPLEGEARARVDALRGLRSGNPLRRLRAYRRSGVYRQSVAEDLLLLSCILSGRVG